MKGLHITGLERDGTCTGLIDTDDWRAICSCGWRSNWTNGYKFPARIAAWWHRRKHR